MSILSDRITVLHNDLYDKVINKLDIDNEVRDITKRAANLIYRAMLISLDNKVWIQPNK